MIAFLLWAEDAAEGQPPPTSSAFMPLFLIGMFFLFYLFIIRPANRRQEQERQAMINSLDKNDQVLTIGGIYATVVSVSEKEDEMIVRLEDNVKMKMTRSSISRNLTKEKAKAESQQPAGQPAATGKEQGK